MALRFTRRWRLECCAGTLPLDGIEAMIGKKEIAEDAESIATDDAPAI